MAIDKSRTPAWMKTVIIVLAVVFVLSFVGIAANPFALFSGSGQNAASGGADALGTIRERHLPNVAALTSQLQSDPESYTVLVQLGNTYYDWAIEVQGASANSTSTVGADQPLWIAAKDSYARAIAQNASESPVMVDYSITQFYSGQTSEAIKTASAVAKADPDFAPAWFNLGIFYSALGDNAKAIESFEKYTKLDPQGTQGNIDYAKQQLQQLRSGDTTP